jgi:arylsulfatase A-like enzyme
MANGQASDHPGFAFSESHSEGNCTGSFMIRKGDWKYLYFTGGDPLLFNMKNEMGEYHDLAGDKKFADVRKELHAHLTSLVEPDRVTLDAFRRQDQILRDRVKSMSRDDFHDDLVGRLGSIQARTITDRHYGGPKA